MQPRINLLPFDIVRKDEHDKYQSVDDIPVIVAGNGVGRGPATAPFNATPEFTLETSQALNPQGVDTLTFSNGVQQSVLTETGNDTKIFESSSGAVKIEVLSDITFDANTYDTFSVHYSNTAASISNQLNSLGETETPGVFRSMSFQMSATFTQPPSLSQVDTMRFTITNSEVGDTISDTLTETGADTLVFSSATSSIAVQISGALSSSQIDDINVEAFFPDIKAYATALSLKETLADSLVFANLASGSTTFANQTPRIPSEKVEVFRVRRYSGQAEDTIQMTVKTSVEEKPITLTRTTGGEFLSEKLLMIREGENISEIPEALLYTVIQVASDADQTSKEIEFKDDVLQQTLTKTNALKSAYIAQSFSVGVLKQQGETFVDLWKVGVPEKLGWALTGNAPDYSATKTKLLEALPKSGLLAWFGHGLRTAASPAFVGIELILPAGESPSAAVNELKQAELPAGLDYEFVFINGCGSATAGNAEADGFIAKFNSRTYLGWTAPAGGAAAGIFANKLIAELDNQQSVKTAVPAAWNKVSTVVKLAALAQNAPGVPRLVWRSDVNSDDKEKFTVDRMK